MYVSEAGVKKELMIQIDGKAFQPPKKILTKDQLLELAELDPKRHEIVMLDSGSVACSLITCILPFGNPQEKGRRGKRKSEDSGEPAQAALYFYLGDNRSIALPIEFSRQAQQKFSPDFKARIMQVYDLFPELLEKRIACGLLTGRGWVEGTATGWTSPPVFRLRPGVSCYTIAHELIHLVQGNGSGVSHGEVACDIWTVDRLPADLLDQRPYYLMKNSRCNWKRNRNAIKELCRQAIEVRKTRRSYIVWLRGQIRQLNAGSRA